MNATEKTVKVRGGKSRSEMMWNRFESTLLDYPETYIRESAYPDNAEGAIELKRVLVATDCGLRAMNLSLSAAEVLANNASAWESYYNDGGHDYDEESKRIARSRAGLSTRILEELYRQGTPRQETKVFPILPIGGTK